MDKDTVRDTLRRMIEKEEDDYEQFRYSDKIYFQIWSPDSVKGKFEIYVIIPHNEVDSSLVGRNYASQLSPEIDGVDQFYDDIDEIIKDVTGDYKSFTFVKSEVIDDGTWNSDATSYVSHTLTA